MKSSRSMRLILTTAAGVALAAAFGWSQADAAGPKKGGTLTYVVPDEPPSWDGHRETTFALVHPFAPFYSVLIRVNPDNPSSPTDFVCDLCTEMPKATDGGKTYTFKIRKGVKFTDGTPLTAHDVVASYKKIVFPPAGTLSARAAYFVMVESVSAPDDYTVVFKLKYPSGAFIPALATPFNFIYSKAKLDADIHWYEKNVLGSGPFKFVAREAGAFVRGERNKDYYVAGRPYLDGFEAIFSNKQAVRVQAIRGDRAAIEFRGFPPKSRDDLVKALGKDHHGAGEQLELRPAVHAEPHEETVRRRPRASRAVAGGGSLGRLEVPVADRHREGGRRCGLPGSPAGGDRCGARKDSGLLARHQQVAGRGQAAA